MAITASDFQIWQTGGIQITVGGGGTGPPGPAGPPGPTGPTGATGATGATGTSDVQSYIDRNITVSPAGTDIAIPAITQSVLDDGLVLVYFGTSQSGPWYPLPYNNGVGLTIVTSSISVGHVVVTSSQSSSGSYFKVVVIPGTAVTLLNVTNPGLNFQNYIQVAAALHLGN